jgi:hypothetical protein
VAYTPDVTVASVTLSDHSRSCPVRPDSRMVMLL